MLVIPKLDSANRSAQIFNQPQLEDEELQQLHLGGDTLSKNTEDKGLSLPLLPLASPQPSSCPNISNKKGTGEVE